MATNPEILKFGYNSFVDQRDRLIEEIADRENLQYRVSKRGKELPFEDSGAVDVKQLKSELSNVICAIESLEAEYSSLLTA